MQWLPISNFIDIKGSKFLLWYVHVFNHRQLYIAFPVGLNAGELDNSKVGLVVSFDGSSGFYLQTKLFGCDPDS